MAPETHPADPLTADLIGVYRTGTQRLRAIMSAALTRGLDPARANTPAARRGDATAAYRARQLAQAQAILAQLERAGTAAAPILAARAFGAGYTVAGEAEPVGEITARFGQPNVLLIETFAEAMRSRFEAAARTARINVELVFARAAVLAGEIPARGAPFVGRRQDDPYRQIALQVLAEGSVAGDTRRQISAELARRLVSEGATDAVTGYVDAAGRRWSLDRYAATTARTTTREAMTGGTVARMRAGRADLITVSRHAHAADECSPFEGRIFSLSGQDTRYPRVERLPPFHPNCRHVAAPAGVNLDDYEAELRRAVGRG